MIPSFMHFPREYPCVMMAASLFGDGDSCFLSVSLNSVIAVLDADFHSLPSTQHRQQYGPVRFS